MGNGPKHDTRLEGRLNQNLRRLIDMVGEKHTLHLPVDDFAHYVGAHSGTTLKTNSVIRWFKNVNPDPTLFPAIFAYFEDRLRLSTPLRIQHFFAEDIREELGRSADELFDSEDLRVTIDDHARFGLEQRAVYEQGLDRILKGYSVDPSTPPISAEAFRRLVDEHIVRFEFGRLDFGASPGGTCSSTAEIEGQLGHLLSRRGIEVRVAPVIGSLRTFVPGLALDDLQRLRITIMASFMHRYLQHLLPLYEKDERRARIAIPGNFHMKQLTMDLTADTIRMIDGVCPLSLTPTEQFDLVRWRESAIQHLPPGARHAEPLHLHCDVFDSLKHRVNPLIFDLKIRAERAGHREFVGRQMTWYPPDAFDRQHLFPLTRLFDYLEERRAAVHKRFPLDPYAAAISIEKIEEVRSYFKALEDVTIAIISLGELKAWGSAESFELDGLVGNILYQDVDAGGEPHPGYDNTVPFGAPLAWLRARNREKRLNTVAMVTGSSKLRILLAAIRGGYITTLLTDADLASRLYEELRKEAKAKHRSPKRTEMPKRRRAKRGNVQA